MESLHYLLMKTHAHINRLILSQAGRDWTFPGAAENFRVPAAARGVQPKGNRGKL